MKESKKQSETGLSKPETAGALSKDVKQWDTGEKFRSAKDIVVSRILPMQGMSKLVTAGKAKFGEFRDSVTEEKIGDLDTPVEFIPIRWELVWIIFTRLNKKEKYKWDSILQIDAKNDGLAYEEEDELTRRDRCLMFTGLRTDDIKGIPSIVSFRRTSMKGGRKLQSLMEDRLKRAGLPPCHNVVKITGEKKTKDDDAYIAMDIEVGRKSTDSEIEIAFEWFNKLKNMDGIKVDNSEFDDSANAENNQGEADLSGGNSDY